MGTKVIFKTTFIVLTRLQNKNDMLNNESVLRKFPYVNCMAGSLSYLSSLVYSQCKRHVWITGSCT